MNWSEMSKQHNTDDAAKPAETPADFGQTLMLAREQAGLSIEYVAAQLNLPEKTVEAIENSDMARLPPAAFVKGYIRNYAKLIDFDAAKLVRDFDASVAYVHEPELHPLSSLPLETSSQTPLIRVVTGFIAVFALLVLVYGAYSYYSRKSEDMELAAVSDTGLQLPPEAPLGIEPDTRFKNTGPPAAGVAETRPAAGPTEEPVATDTASATETLKAVPPVQTPPPEAAQQLAAVEPVTAEPAVEAATDRDVLVLEASADSWAEIRDATGERKFYGLLEQNRTRTLTGVAPFDIFLGNAPAVRMTLDDVGVDMTNHTRSNNIAHFKVSVENGRARFH